MLADVFAAAGRTTRASMRGGGSLAGSGSNTSPAPMETSASTMTEKNPMASASAISAIGSS